MSKKIGDLRDESGIRRAMRLREFPPRLPFEITERAEFFLLLAGLSVDVRLSEPMGVDCSAQLR
jgi:hypothetical protein